jgi:RHS repeat-associated protein
VAAAVPAPIIEADVTQTKDAPREEEAPRRRTAHAGRVAVGHPVDVASGEQYTAAHDVEVAGVSPLIFRRVYNTRFLDRPPSVLGLGWVHAFEATLEKDLDGYVFEGHDGDRVEFDDLDLDFDRKGSLGNPSASMELRREGDRLVVYHWHNAEEPVQKYVFDRRHGERMPLIARELPSGQGIEVARDASGRVATLTQNTEQRRLYLRYDARGRLASLHLGLASDGIEAAQCVARYRYDEPGRLIAVEDALGKSCEYGYDDAGRLTLESDRSGGVYRMAYDAQGRCIESTGTDRYKQKRFIYEPGQTTRVIDGQGRETLYQYNDLGQVERRIEPSGATFVTEFDDAGRIVKEIDPVGATTAWSYDEPGRVATKTFPNGARITYEYDEYHQPARIIEPDGAVWALRYERGALTDVTDPFGRQVHYVRGQRNQLIGASTSSGQELRIRTNDTWTEETIEDALGLIVRRKLDVYLNPTEVEDSRGPVGAAEYDPLGRLSVSRRPDGSVRRFEYDAEGRIVRLLDARGGEWRARYSPYGDCLEQIDPIGRAHRFSWDIEGRLSAIQNPRREDARFGYDLGGNLARIQHFDGSVEEARYDQAARLVARKRPDGTQLELERDVVGNLLCIRHGEQKLRTFEYDLCGSVLSAGSQDSEVLFEYAVGGRVQAEVQQGRRIEYEYGPRGFLAKRSFQGSQIGPLHFEHDSRGRLRRFSTERGEVQAYTYDGSDQCTERRLGPLTEKRQYDLQGRLRHQQLPGINTRTFNYDSEGALIELVDKLRGRREYKYDLSEQLLSSINEKLGEHLYSYDENGNLTGKDTQGLAYDSGNRLRQLGDTVFERDANGQLVRQTSTQRDDRYEWDVLGQLRLAKHRDGATTRFGYDAFGRRVFKHHEPTASQPAQADPLASSAWAHTSLPGEPVDPVDTSPHHLLAGRTQYFWAGDDLLAEAREGALTEYAMWGFVAEALWENGQLRHVVNSQQGVAQELIDQNGKLVWQGTFDDWGKLIAETGATTCRLRLPGQIADDETGLHYNRFRYYSPDAGQFVSPDPIGFKSDTNLYRHSPNLVDWLDPLGLTCKKDGCRSRQEAFQAQKDALGIPRSQQPVRSWTIHDPARVKGAGVRSGDPRAQGRIYEYQITGPGGATQMVYIADHNHDPFHGGIGHIHQGLPKPGATSVAPGTRYTETGTLLAYGRK